MSTAPIYLKPWQAEYGMPAAMAFMELPSLQTMRQRLILAMDTPYQQWATDALLLAAVLTQAQNLDSIARHALTNPTEASELALGNSGHMHMSLRHLQLAVFHQAIEIEKKQERQARREAKKALRTAATAAKGGTGPPKVA